MESVYSGLATVGKASAIMGIVMAVIVSIALIALAIYFLRKNQSDIANSTAKVTESTCSGTGDSITCNMRINYNINGKSYTGNISSFGTTTYTTGMDVPISYNIKNPSDVTYRQANDKVLAYIFIGIAIFILLAAGFNYYMVSHSKVISAGEGLGTTFDVLRRL
jgi:flagellar basal body-associated protein FliL